MSGSKRACKQLVRARSLWLLAKVRLILAATRSPLRLGLCLRRCGQKLLPTVVAAEIECLASAFGMQSCGLIYGHSANGVLGDCFRIFHSSVTFLSLPFSAMRGASVAARARQPLHAWNAQVHLPPTIPCSRQTTLELASTSNCRSACGVSAIRRAAEEGRASVSGRSLRTCADPVSLQRRLIVSTNAGLPEPCGVGGWFGMPLS